MLLRIDTSKVTLSTDVNKTTLICSNMPSPKLGAVSLNVYYPGYISANKYTAQPVWCQVRK